MLKQVTTIPLLASFLLVSSCTKDAADYAEEACYKYGVSTYDKNNNKVYECKQSGNVLFLILIAVALFAALSYAVTQSGRGGGNTSKEKTKILVSQFIQEANFITTTIKRKYILGDNRQIQLTPFAENASGTVYLPDLTTATGPTVGFYTKEISGFTDYLRPSSELTITTSSGWSIIYNSQLVHDGVDVGTTLGDTFLRISSLTEAACTEINKNLHGTTNIGSFSGSWGSSNAYNHLSHAGYGGGGAWLDRTNITYLPGCNASSSYNRAYYELIKQN